MRKRAFCIFKSKGTDLLHGIRAADQHFCFATLIIQTLYFLNPKFQASGHLLWLCSMVCRTWSANQKTGFLTTRLICICSLCMAEMGFHDVVQ